MYTIDDKSLLKCDHNRRPRKGTVNVYRGIVRLVAMLVALVYIGCEEPSSDTSSSVAVSAPVFGGGGRILSSRAARDDGSVALLNPAVGADGVLYIATGTALYAIEAEGTYKWKYEPTGAITSSPVVGRSDGVLYIATGTALHAINANDGTLKRENTLELPETITNDSTLPVAVGVDGVLYIAKGATLYAIEADGTEKGNIDIPGTITTAPVVGVDGTIYIASGNTLYVIGAEADGTLTLKRQFELPETITVAITSSPVVGADGVIYIASGNTLYAINAEGTERQFKLPDLIVTAPAISRDAVVYVGTDDGNLYAIDVDVERKKYRTGGGVASSPAVGADGTIYVGSDDGNLHAIRSDGTKKWSYATRGAVRSSPAIGLDGTIYVGSDDSKLHAIRSDGTRKWVYATGGPVRSSPAIGLDGTIYVGSDDSKLHAIRSDGTKKWSYKTEGRVQSSPAVGNIASEERIYVGSNAPDNHLYVLDTSGDALWKWDLLGGVESSPALGKEGEVYIGSSNGFVYAFNANSTLRWSYKTSGAVVSSPAIMVDGEGVSTIIIGTVDGVHAIDGEQGTTLWVYATRGAVASSPAIGSDGTIYVGSEDGSFYRLDENGKIEKEEYIGSVGLSSSVIGENRVIVGTQTGIVYVLESESTGYGAGPWPGRGHDGVHSGRGEQAGAFERYELQAPGEKHRETHYNRFKIVLDYTDKMAGTNKAGAPLSANDVRMTLYYGKREIFSSLKPTPVDLVSVVTKDGSGLNATADRGSVSMRILNTLMENALETRGVLTADTEYYYVIEAVQEKEPRGTRYSAVTQMKTLYEPISPGMATGLRADTDTERQLTFTADIPDHFGKKADGTPVVDKSKVKYWLYYAQVGYTPDGKAQVTTSTTAAAVVAAVDTVIGTSDKNIGRIERVGKSARDTVKFTLDGLIGGAQYRYTIITIHRNDASKQSTPAPAKTATVKSEATAPGAVTIQVPDTTTKGQLTFHVTSPTAGNFGKKADGTIDVVADEVTYWLYYARVGYSTITDGSTAAEVASAVGAATDAGRIEQTNTNLGTGFVLDGVTGGAAYRYTVVVVHPDGILTSALTPAETATVKSEATAPAAVTSPTVTEASGIVTITATAPAADNRGTKINGAAVGEGEIKYWLYYARVGYSTITTGTTAADVVTAVGTAPTPAHAQENAGKVAITGNTALRTTGFLLDGVTGGAQYRYTIITVHPEDDALKSAPTPARTVTVQSKATAGPAFVLNAPTGTTKSGFTIGWDAGTFVASTHKKVGGGALGAGDMRYKVYYASSGTVLADAATIKVAAKAAEADSSVNTGGIKTVGKNVLTATIAGKAFVGTVYIVVESIYASKTRGSTTRSYLVTGARAPPDAVALTPTSVTAGKGTLTVNVLALTAGFGTNDTGGALDGTKLTYLFYYAKQGVAIGGRNAEHEDTTADKLVDALQGYGAGGTPNTAEKGKVTLTAGAGIGTATAVRNLAGLTDYYYTVRVQETVNAVNGANTAKADTQTLSAAVAPSRATAVTVTAGTAKLTVNVLALTAGNRGKDKDGKALTPSDLTYLFYYAKQGEVIGGRTAETATADQLVAALKILTTNTAEKGKVTLTAGTNKEVRNLANFENYYYTVRVQETANADNGANTAKADTQTLSAATAPHKVTSQTAVTATARQLTFTATPPAANNRGTKANGDAVAADEVKYWLYYAQVGVIENSVTVTTSTTAEHVVEAVDAVTGTDNKNIGKIELTGNTGTEMAFVLDGVTGGKQYRYTIIAVHPEYPDDNTLKSAYATGTATVKSEAAAGDAVGITRITVTSTTAGFNITGITAPTADNRGTKINGDAVSEDEITYELYYAKVGHSGVDTSTTAAEIAALATATGVNAGKTGAIRNAALTRTGFTITGLPKGATYRYFIRTLHPVNATLFADTAVQSAKSNQAAAPAAVTIPTVTEASGIVTITATAPAADNRGTKINGAAVGEGEIKYWLYYARVGYSTITTGTTAADVVTAVGTAPTPAHAQENAGKVAITGNTALRTTGFLLDGVTGGAQYRYTIITVHPEDDALKSAPTPARTVTVQSKATAGPAFVLNAPTGTTKSGFTIGWDAGTFVASTHKKVGGGALGAGDMRYKVYYASSGTVLADAATIKVAAKAAEADSSVNTGGIKTVGKNVLTATIAGKAFVGTVYIVVESIYASKTRGSTTRSYLVTGARAPPDAVALTPTSVTAGKGTLTVNVLALTAGFGTNDTGGALDGTKLTYLFYYAKQGVAIGGRNAEHEDTTADKLVDALQGYGAGGTPNTAEKGKVTLTAGAGIGTATAVRNLAGLTDYYYTVRVQETVNAVNGANTAKADTQTLSAAVAPSRATAVTVTAGTAKLTVNVLALTAGNRGKDKDGKALTPSDLTYLFYYAKQGEVIGGRTAETATADQLVAALKILTTNTAEKGKVTLTAGTNKEVRNLANFENYYYTVRVQETANADNGANTAKADTQTLSAATAPHKVTSQTAVTATARQLTFTATPPAANNRGTKANGDAVAADEVKYWLYYAQVGVIENSVTVTTSTTAEHVVEAVDAVTGTDNKNIGKIELTGNTGTEMAFVLDGVTGGKQYRYTIIAVHPEYPDDNTLKSAYATGTATVKSEAAAGDAVGITRITVTSTTAGFNITGITAPTADNRGTKINGDAVSEDEITYELYYAKVGHSGVDTSTTAAEIAALATATGVNAGKTGAIRNAALTRTGFTITGLPKGATYRYFIRTLHPVNATLFADTAVQSAKSNQAAAPAAVTIPTVTEASGIVTITATAPAADNRGTKINGAAVGEGEIKYWLYYARVGYSTITTGTTAADVVTAVGTAPTPAHAQENAGKVAITGNTALRTTGFLLDGVTGGAQYRYTIITVHPEDDALKSAPTPARTVTVQSKATAGPAFVLNAPTGTTKSGFTIGWDAGTFVASTHKKVGGGALGAGDMRYKVYYASSGTVLADAATIKVAAKAAEADSSVNTGGIKTVGKNVLTATIAGKAFVGTVYIVVESIYASKTRGSTTRSYLVTGARAPPDAVALTPTSVTAGKGTLTVNVLALTAGFGTNDTGGALDGTKLTYLFYYAKQGVAIGGRNAEHEDTTADKLVDALQGYGAGGTPNTAEKGKVTLTAGAGIGTATAVRNLAGLTDYYYTVRVQETVNAVNGANTAKADTQTLSAAVAPSRATAVTVTAGTAKLTVNVLALTAGNRGKDKDGKALTPSDLTYLFYYAKQGEVIGGRTAETATADQLVAALKILTTNTAEKGKVTLTAGTNKEVRNLANFENYYYTVRVQETANADNGANTAKADTQTLSAATAPHKVTSQTAVTATARQLTFTATPPAANNRGTKANGDAVAADEVKYWLYYAQVGVIENSVTVTTSTTAEHVVEAVDAVTGTDNKNIGKIELTGNTGTEMAFVLDGVTGGKQYRYTIIAVHPEYPDDNTLKSAYATGTATVKSEAAAGDAVGITRITVTSTTAGFNITGITAPTADNRGTKINGDAVSEDEITYELYYAKVGHSGVDTSTTAAEIAALATATGVNAGKTGAIRNAALTRTGFTITGLPKGATYRYFIRTLHPVNATLFADTAVQSAKSNQAAAPAAVTIPTVTEASGIVTITATAPAADNRGTKINGAAVGEGEIKYWLYYARVGYSTITTGTTAADVVTAVGTAPTPAHAQENAGKVAITGNTALRTTGFLLDGVTGGAQYRYTIITVHPEDDALKSAPTPARTVTVQSKATAPAAVTVSDLVIKGDGTTVTITATAPAVLGKQVSGDAVGVGEIKYELYYAKVGGAGTDGVSAYGDTSAITNTIKNKATTSGVTAATAGKVAITGNTKFTVTGISADFIYRYFIRSINPSEETKYSDTSDTLMFVLPSNGVVKIVSDEKPAGTPRTTIANEEYKWTAGKTKITHVAIPDTVTSIGNYAFRENSLTDVVIPNSVTSIGEKAFRKNKLTSITIGTAVETIGDHAFSGDWEVSNDNALTEVVIPNSVISIGKHAFYNNKLTTVTIGTAVETIDEFAFYDNQLTDVVIPNSVTTINQKAFQKNKLTSVTLGNNVTTIGQYAFTGKKNKSKNQITGVVIPNSVTSIGQSAFADNALTSLTIGSGLTAISRYVFAGNATLTSVVIPDTVTSISDNAFTYNLALMTVTLKNTLFNGLKNANRLSGVFGTQVTRYQDADGNTFSTAPAAVTIQTPDVSVIRQLTFKATPPSNRGTKADGTAVAATDITYRLYYVRVGYTPSGKARVTTSTTETDIVAAVGIVTGMSNKNIGKVDLTGNTGTEIAFVLDGLTGGKQYRYTIVSIHPEYPDDNTLKSAYATGTATVKSEATAPAAVTNPSVAIPTAKDRFTITATHPDNRGMQADGNDVGVGEIKYELYYAKVGHSTITDSSSSADIATVVGAVPNNNAGKIAITGNPALTTGFTGSISSDTTYRYFIRSIHPTDENLYADTPPLTFDSKTSGNTHTLTISATKKDGTARTAIEPSAYRDKGFTSAVISDSVESIGEYAFYGRRGAVDGVFESVTLGKSLKSIDDNAFQYNKLKSIIIPDSVEQINSFAFADNQLISVMLGNRRTSRLEFIGGFAFANNQLTSVTIPDSVTRIKRGVFTGNPNLETVTLKKSLYDTIRAQSGGLSEVFGTQVTLYQDHDGNTFSTAPAAVTVADTVITGDGTTVTIAATAPAVRGTKINGDAVAPNEIKYELYYAKVGGTGTDDVSAYGDTDTTAIKTKLESGVIAATAGNTTFTVTGISADWIYRYFIRSIHPFDNTLYSDTSDTLMFVLPSDGVVEIVSTDDPAGSGTTRTEIAERMHSRDVIENNGHGTDRDAITHVVIPDKVTTINKYAFDRNAIRHVVIPNSVTSINQSAFALNAITSLTLGTAVTTIQKWVFTGNQLTSVVIPNSVTNIMYQAFDKNPNLKTITLTKTLYDTIRTQSGGLASVFGTQVTRYQDADGNTFSTAPAAVTVADTVITGDGTKVTITATAPSDRGTKVNGTTVGVDEIKYELYYAKVGGDDGVSAYGDTDTTAIKTKLESGVIAATAGNTTFTVTGISADFIYRYFIRSIHPSEETKYSDTSDTLMFVLPSDGVVEIVSAKKPDGTPRTEIAERMHSRDVIENNGHGTDKDAITHVVIPDTVTTINKYAFDRNAIRRVVIPNSVTSINQSAFAVNQLTSVTIGTAVTTIQKWVFANNKLKSVTIPNSVTTILAGAFTVNSDLKTITLSKALYDTIKAQSGGLAGVFGTQVTLYLNIENRRALSDTENFHIVQFNTNGGTDVVNQAVTNRGGTVVEPYNPTKTNFIFLHWYKSGAFNRAKFGFTTTITAATTLYAKWVPAWKAVAVGSSHTVGIRKNGTLWAWGKNNVGQLGLGHTDNKNIPTRVGTATNWRAVTAVDNYTFGIDTDGRLYAWGKNDRGKLGLGHTNNRNIPTRVGTATNWRAVTPGGSFTVGINTDGELYAWGRNNVGQLGLGHTNNKNIPTRVGTATNWRAVSAGSGYTVGINTDGELYAWGYNGSGQLGLGHTDNKNIPTRVGTATNWRAVSAGNAHTVGINTDGELYAWGLNNVSQLGLGHTNNKNIPTRVGTATNWRAVSAGSGHTVGIRKNGTLWAWGLNTVSQLGLGGTHNRNTPTKVGSAKWQAVSAGSGHTVGINTDGTLWVWGKNHKGQLGLGSNTNIRNTPRLVDKPITP